ncbi:MAG: VOC family protein [Mycolicibacterium rufum]|nr:VOC family protein [Mycolicibacterium rufum]
MDFRLEVVIVPVSDVDKALSFYHNRLGWRLDADFAVTDGYRIVQVTPPGSPASVIFGDGVSAATPGSVGGLLLVVDDIRAAREELLARGVEVSEVFHDESGVFTRPGTVGRVAGPGAQGSSYTSHATFGDPDGNQWVLQEVTTRLPGR